MKFRYLEISNWRSFLGTHKLEFSNNKNQNITVIVGQNGSGKTALLNAFTWGLFGVTTAGFRQPSDLFNHLALGQLQPSETKQMYVTIGFEHDGFEYTVKRSQTANLLSNGELSVDDAVFNATRKKGTTDLIIQEEINSILPPDLNPFFFFPAENIGKELMSADTTTIRSSMKSAIDTMLGIYLYDSARQLVASALTNELKIPRNAPKNDLVEKAEQEMSAARDVFEKATRRKKVLPELIKSEEELVGELKAQLDKSQEHQAAISKFEKLSQDLSIESGVAENMLEKQEQIINENCAIIFGNQLYSDALSILNEAHKTGKIPPRISAGLLDDLLENKEKCICGRKLEEEEVRALQRLRSLTVDDEIAELASEIRGRIGSLIFDSDSNQRDTAVAKKYLDSVTNYTTSLEKQRVLKSRIAEVLRETPELKTTTDQSKTMEAWQEATLRLSNFRIELKQLSSDLKTYEKKYRDAEKKYIRKLSGVDRAQNIGAARQILSNVEQVLVQIQEAIRTSAKSDVERTMNKFFGELISKRNYQIGLSEDFHYEIHDKKLKTVVGASSSEVALATFSFVGAIASLIPVYSDLEQILPMGDDKSVGGLTGDLHRAFPVVLDAPYSPFGDQYSIRFSEKLPELIPQSIIIIREDHIPFIEPLLEANRIGAAYLIKLFSDDDSGQNFEWIGDSYEYVVNVPAGDPSYSEISPLPVRK